MKVKVRLFITFRQYKSNDTIEITLQRGSKVVDLLFQLAKIYGEDFEKTVWDEDGKPFVAIMLNGVSRSLETELKDNDEIALVPPVAGGATAIKIRIEC